MIPRRPQSVQSLVMVVTHSHHNKQAAVATIKISKSLANNIILASKTVQTKAYALVTANKHTQSNSKPVSKVGYLYLLLLSTSCGSLPSQIHRKLSKMAVLRIVGNQPGNHYYQSGRTTLEITVPECNSTSMLRADNFQTIN